MAFEQREQGKREAERIQEEKRAERLEKIRALYSSYNNYASQGDGDNAIIKALRDFSILEAITASFGDGGVVGDVLDKMPTDGRGIIRGQSHKGNTKGIPVLVERNEGIFSASEMANLGKDNFYKMKEMASMGKIDSNFFTQQRKSVAAFVPMANAQPELLHQMKQVQQAIENKPVPHWDLEKLHDGSLHLIETITTKNHVKRNHYKTKKPRI